MPSIQRNLSLNVTGCLWFGPGRFLQILEGASAEVDELYTSIEADRRHSEVTLLVRQPIAARRFERWSLKSVRGDEPAEMGRLVEDLVGRSASSWERGAAPGPVRPVRPAQMSVVARAIGLLAGARQDLNPPGP